MAVIMSRVSVAVSVAVLVFAILACK